MSKETGFDSFVKPGEQHSFRARSRGKRMRCIYLIFLLFFIPFYPQAQHNLVLNPGFEEYNPGSCKTDWLEDMAYIFDSMTVKHWYNPILGDYESTPDFYLDIPPFSKSPYFSRGPRSGKACAKIVPIQVKGFTNGKIDTVNNIREFVEGLMGFPNAFTPNGDGRNDLFRPVIQDLQKIGEYDCSVYNRYGQQVFHSTNPAEGWDRSYLGKMMELGTYFYQCTYKEAGTGQLLKGSVHLLY